MYLTSKKKKKKKKKTHTKSKKKRKTCRQSKPSTVINFSRKISHKLSHKTLTQVQESVAFALKTTENKRTYNFFYHVNVKA